MSLIQEKKYQLAPGTQVREEDFGLLFYTMSGPHLYFLSSGDLLDDGFFEGTMTLEQVIKMGQEDHRKNRFDQIVSLQKSLNQLKEKGVIFEC